jgi:hypothetical protein
MKHYPTPPRNPALDPFRLRKWSESAFLVPTLRALPRKFTRRGKVFLIVKDERRFAVVAPNKAAAESRINALLP